VIFVGDYVYHFSYDRKALLQLYAFFLELVQQGKEVYVMSGNHDWIQEHFVYAESAQAFQIFSWALIGTTGKLEFITECCRRTIEDKQIFFVPFYMLEDQERGGSFDALLDSSNKQEQQSGRINTLMERALNNATLSGDIYMIHHRYIEGQAFPWQQAVFSYKSPALSSSWLDYPGIKLISGHLHQPFSYKNYLCVGSVWYTSPLEYNQAKFGFCLDTLWQVTAQQLIVNPYIHGTLAQVTSQEALSSHLQDIYSKACNNFASSQWDITSWWFDMPDLWLLSVTIRDDTLSYDTLQTSVDAEIFASVADMSIKKQSVKMEEFVALLETGSQQLTESIADWKTLLLQYIQQKYWPRSVVYEDVLRELGLI
jgi:DNA repair exonuclease SbcCD nuclease subunit